MSVPECDAGSADPRQQFAYLFEAKGIGAYLGETGRLIDLIGGSDLIAELCSSDGTDVLGSVLAAAENPTLSFSRRAGGAFCLHAADRDALDRLRALWRLTVGLTRPGLAYTDTDPAAARAESEKAALRAAYAAQPGLRENGAALLPPAGQPVAEFDRRTGRPAAETEAKGGDAERLDGIVAPQRARGRRISASGAQDRLARRFLPADDAAAKPYRFPRHFDPAEASRENPAFPFPGRDRRVAVVRADISGLGQTFRNLTDTAGGAAEVLKVATAIEAAIGAAARAASEEVLLPAAMDDRHPRYPALFGPKGSETPPKGLKIVPARPVLLGGDDIAIIVRADLAPAFTLALIAGIEAETAKLSAIFPDYGFPAKLTATAGLAIVGAGHPFQAADRLAMGMCKAAKKLVKAGLAAGAVPPSAVSFAVVTSTLDEDFPDWRDREQRLPQAGLALSACPYLTASGTQARPLGAVVALARALEGVEGRGKLIEAIAARDQNPTLAATQWQRFWEVLGREDRAGAESLQLALKAFGIDAAGIPALDPAQARARLDDALPYLNDALELIDIGALGPLAAATPRPAAGGQDG